MFSTFHQNYSPAHNGIRPPTLASWIVETIRSAYPEGVTPDSEEQAKSSSGVPHAHDVRGVSASWAKFHNVPLESILRAATWKSETTFMSSYVKDISLAESYYGVQVISASTAVALSFPAPLLDSRDLSSMQ